MLSYRHMHKSHPLEGQLTSLLNQETILPPFTHWFHYFLSINIFVLCPMSWLWHLYHSFFFFFFTIIWSQFILKSWKASNSQAGQIADCTHVSMGVGTHIFIILCLINNELNKIFISMRVMILPFSENYLLMRQLQWRLWW